MLSLAALAVGCAPVCAQSVPTKVGVINIQSALVSTKDGQKAVADLQARQAPKQKELEKKQADIKSLQDSLNRGGNAMSEQAKEELIRSIDTKTKQFNRDLQDARSDADQDEQKVLNELGQRMMVVIDKYARDHGFSVILDVSNPQTPVLYASNSVDITKDIIDLYDKNSPGPVNATSSAPANNGNAVKTPPSITPPHPAAARPATPAAKKP